MKNIKTSVKIIAKLMIGVFSLYVFQYIVVPLFAIYNNQTSIIFYVSSILYAIIAIVFITGKLRYLLLSDILYFILVNIYHYPGIYGIGMRGMDLDGAHSFYDKSVAIFGIIINLALIIIMQLLVWVLYKVYKVIIKKRKDHN